MIRLAVFDIDGTLKSNVDHTIARESIDAVSCLRKKGIKVAIASGRQFQNIQPELRAIGFDYYILANGSYVTDSRGEVLYQHEIDALTVESLRKDFVERDQPLELRYTSGYYSANPNQSLTKYTLKLFSKEQVASDLQAMVKEDPAICGLLPFACVGHIEPQDWDYFLQKYPQLHFISIFDGLLCDINRSGVSKATGLADICGYLGIDIQDTIAFGDDINDVELIHAAGIGVAMGNAVPEVRDAADYVTSRSEDLGVVKGLMYFGLLEGVNGDGK